MQGNSLLERFEEIDLSKVHTITRTTTIYEPQKDIFGNITNPQLKLTDNTVLRDNDLQKLMNDFFIARLSQQEDILMQPTGTGTTSKRLFLFI